MAVSYKTKELKRALEALPQVVSVSGIKVEDGIIKCISIDTRAIGRITARQLEINDASTLFDFYSKGLFEKARRLFAPYPLFHTPPSSTDELAGRIADWKIEDDWTVINLVKDKQIIGLGLLKRFWTEQVTSGIAIRDDFLKMGLGYILQNIIIEQARLLNLKKFHVKIVSDNLSSVRLHEKCGFRKTRILPPPIYEEILKYLSECDKKNGNEAVDRHIIEMVKEVNYD
ncbi:GNAT family N-acetyltransferase [Patescibacteria group bacterium]|nr:GNAT family N-acetyltransferase [Patescibacteria group bacterium]